MAANQQEWTVPRVVASNMKRLRMKRRWTQAHTARTISDNLSGSWSVKTYSNAEGTRPLRFTAEELMAIALAFDISLVELFRPIEALPSGEVRERLEAVGQVDDERASAIPSNDEETVRNALLQLSRNQAEAAHYAEKIADMFKRR